MSRSKWSARRKSLAIGLAVVGVAGLSLASASQLGFNWTSSTFQAGTVPTVTTDCQLSADKITAGYAAPTFTSTQSTPWSVQTITFSGIDQACNAKNFEVAYSTTSGSTVWVQLPGGTGSVSATSSTLSSNVITVPLPTVDVASITGWALTIHS